jgi:acetyl-CoA carboxylase biotin carboxyl carrier protein
MTVATLAALVADAPGGGTFLRAPKVGLWSDHPPNGAFVEAGSRVGTITQVRRRFALVVPEGVSGRIEIAARSLASLPVAYGDVLVRVVPAALAGDAASSGPAAPAAGASAGLTVAAPTDGVFYKAPATGARPYAAVGDRVVTGQPVGLIEVMKTFNPILYGGAGLPEEAEVVAVLVDDEAEVRAGQPLVVVKKL